MIVTHLRSSLSTLALAAALLFALTSTTHALVECDFSRDLEYGIDGEDVRCLQRYLNDAGFTVAVTGPGAPAGETTLFRDATEDAVVAWQEANNVYPASGYFGPLSREKYRTLVNLGVSTIEEALTETDTTDTSPTVPPLPGGLAGLPTLGESSSDEDDAIDALGLSPEVAALMRSMLGGDDTDEADEQITAPLPSAREREVRDLLLAAVRAIEDAEDQIEDEDVSGEKMIEAKGNYEDARDDLFDAIGAFLTGDLEEALDLADDAYDNAHDALEDAGGDDPETEAEEQYDELEEELADAWERIEEADDDGDEVGLSERYLEDADDLLDEADELLDDDEYGEALDVLDEVEELIEDAIDAIGSDENEEDDDYKDAERDIEDARDELDDAWDDLEEAIEDNEPTGDAENLLIEADDLLDEAEEQLEDEDYDEVEELVEEAFELIDEAQDEL